MSNVLFFPNLKKQNERAVQTATIAQDDSSVDHVCADVFPRNSTTDPLNINIVSSATLPVTGAAYTYKEKRFMNCATTNINGSGGAWIQIGDTDFPAANIANTISEIRINANLGNALQFGKGANAGAVTEIGASGAGQSLALGVSLVAGDKVWVRAVQSAAVSSGELLVLFLG